MTFEVNGEKLFSVSEACRLAGTTRNTFLRWVRENKIRDTHYRDRNGWRLFNEEEIADLKMRVCQIRITNEK